MAQEKTNISQNNIKIVDDIYTEISNEFEQIQTFIGMYISYKGTRGAIHLFKEIFNNALDECFNPNSCGDKIEVFFDEATREIIVSDNGRGIPFEKMIDVCTKKHTSTKIHREYNKYSTGQNGVGITIAVALSDYFSMTCNRGLESKTIEFTDCTMKENQVKKNKSEKYGTTVRFIPSEKYLEKIDMRVDDILDWLRRISYIMPDGIKIKFYGSKRGSEATITRTFVRAGLPSNVEYLSQHLEFSPINLITSDDKMDLEIAFSYDKTLDDEIIESYCNYVFTIDGGYHEIAAKRAICEFFSREARKLDPNSKYEVTFDDCRKGLVLVCNCRHMNPEFGGQVKSKVENKDIQLDGKHGLMSALSDYFLSNESQLRKIIAYLRQMSRIRLEAYKIKGVKIEKAKSFLDDMEIRCYYPIADRRWKGYKELIICEGNSASGQIAAGRNPQYQAVIGLRGVINNTFEMTAAQVLTKQTMLQLVKVLGCGIGGSFNINNLIWNKVIIMTDADIDGFYITSLLCAFFAKHMPKIIEEGRLYKSISPLYILSDNTKTKKLKKKFLFDRREYNRIFFNQIASNVDVGIPLQKNSMVLMKKSEKLIWLDLNKEYLIELINLGKRAATDTKILEYICWYLIQSDGDESRFAKLIEKKFSELTYNFDGKSIHGSVSGESVSLIVDSIFLKMASRYMDILENNKSIEVVYKNTSDDGARFVTGTIGEFLNDMGMKYSLDIEQRYKGLGEFEATALFESTLNPRIRKLLRITMDDVSRAMQTLEILHGRLNSEERRKLLENGKISLDDIDN